MNNLWQSPDVVEPFLVWDVVAPLDRPPQRFDLLEEILTACAESRLLRIRAVDVAGLQLGATSDPLGWARLARARDLPEVLPFEDALHGGDGTCSLLSSVFARDDQGRVVERDADDAGALLRTLDPKLDPAWARRFAASHPFIGLWSTTTDRRLEVRFGFWCTLFFDTTDAELHEKNQARLQQLHDGLRAVAARHRGSADLPLSLR